MQLAISDGVKLILKNDLETCHDNFDQPWKGWLTHFGISRGIICLGTWRTLNSGRILRALGAIRVHNGFLPGKTQVDASVQALQSKAECSGMARLFGDI